jgi:hypothetical protein
MEIGAIRSRLAHPAERLMNRSDRPSMIKRINRQMCDAGILDTGLDPQASPQEFAEQAFHHNGNLPYINLPSALGADDPRE